MPFSKSTEYHSYNISYLCAERSRTIPSPKSRQRCQMLPAMDHVGCQTTDWEAVASPCETTRWLSWKVGGQLDGVNGSRLVGQTEGLPDQKTYFATTTCVAVNLKWCCYCLLWSFKILFRSYWSRISTTESTYVSQFHGAGFHRRDSHL